MKVFRKVEKEINLQKDFNIGDQILVSDDGFTATCQKVGKKGAIFLMDQYLDSQISMNNFCINEGGYEVSELRKYLITISDWRLFDNIREYMVPFKNGDLIRIPTVEEIFGITDYIKANYEILSTKNKQWPLMKDRRNRISNSDELHDELYVWLQNIHKGSLNFEFATISSYGYLKHTSALDMNGVRIVFRLNLKEDIYE